MNLQEIRKQFVVSTGLYHLVSDDGSDNGANFYINAGLRYLEGLLNVGKAQAVRSVSLVNGTAVLPYFRSVTKVKIRLFSNTDWLDAPRAIPNRSIDYSIVKSPSGYVHQVIDSRGMVEELYGEADDVMLSSDAGRETPVMQASNQLSLVIHPTPTELYQCQVEGLVRELLLVDEDECYISREYPQLLIFAAAREVETMNRNTQGINDWDAAITRYMVQIDQEAVWLEAEHIDQMEG